MPEGCFLRRILSDPADGLTRFFLSFFSDLNFVGHRFLSEIRTLAEALQETLSSISSCPRELVQGSSRWLRNLPIGPMSFPTFQPPFARTACLAPRRVRRFAVQARREW